MTDGAFSQVGGASLRGPHGFRRGSSGLCGGGGGLEDGHGIATGLGGRAGGIEGGRPRVHHGLFARGGLAARLNPFERARDHRGSAGTVQLAVTGGLRCAQDRGPVQGSGGPADRGHERLGDGLEHLGDAARLGLAQGLERGRESAIHVLAVVAVPDRSVQVHQIVALLGDICRRQLDPPLCPRCI